MNNYKISFTDESGIKFSMNIKADSKEEAKSKFKMDYPSLIILSIK
jgi:hypothetical protein